jgi:hypothetical protein
MRVCSRCWVGRGWSPGFSRFFCVKTGSSRDSNHPRLAPFHEPPRPCLNVFSLAFGSIETQCAVDFTYSAAKSQLTRFGPTTPKLIDPRLLPSIRPKRVAPWCSAVVVTWCALLPSLPSVPLQIEQKATKATKTVSIVEQISGVGHDNGASVGRHRSDNTEAHRSEVALSDHNRSGLRRGARRSWQPGVLCCLRCLLFLSALNKRQQRQQRRCRCSTIM